MGEKVTEAAAGMEDQDGAAAAAAAPGLDGIQYCSEHPYRPGAAAAAAVGGICAFCLQEKLGRLVARSRSVGCGSRSFSGDFLERISNGFGDCTLRRVESQREPKPNKMRALGHLGGGGGGADDDDDDDDAYQHQHRIKCAGFFGGMGPTPSYWLSAAEGAATGGGARKSGGRSHRSWAWTALASPMRALRPTSSTTTTTTKTITAVHSSHVVAHSNGSTPAAALSISSPVPASSTATD
uniref:Uncharacterized protein n=1 Tax=Oryza punctata TaxID=4537 RepID=A0A0E0K0J3_ORYPU